MKKIYFAGSIRGGREDKDLYLELIKYLGKYGQVLTEHIGDKNLSDLGENTLEDETIYTRDFNWVKEADVLVAEVTTPSLGVGYEIGKAEEMGKRVLCLYRKNGIKKLSPMLNGNKNLKTVVYEDLNEACKYMDKFFEG